MKRLACSVFCLALLLLSGCAQTSPDPPSRPPGPAYNGSMGGGDGGGGGGGGDGGGM